MKRKKIIKNLSRLIVFIVGISMMAMSLTALANDYYTNDSESILENECEYDENIFSDEDDDDEGDDNDALSDDRAPEEDDAVESSSDSRYSEASGAIAAFGSSLPVSAPPTPIGSITTFDPFTPWVIPQHFTFEEIALWGADTIIIRDLSGNPIGELPITAGMLSGLDTSIPGNAAIIVTLVVNGQSFSTTQLVYVDATVDMICDCLTPIPTLFPSYFPTMFVGTTLANSGIQVIVMCCFFSGCGRNISVGIGTVVTEDMICSFPSNIPGAHTLTIDYLGAIGTIDVYFDTPNLGPNSKLHFPADFFFLLPGNTIESLNIFGFLKTDDHNPICYANFICDCPIQSLPLCMQFFTVTTEMALAGGFNPLLRGPQEITITFLGETETITIEILGAPVCVCPPGCCKDEDCCGIDNECDCLCMCICPGCDELLRNCKCCDDCREYPCVCPCRDALREAKRSASAIVRGRHTAATWNAFIAALERARLVYENPNATQAEIDAAKLELLAAKDALEKYPRNNQNNVITGVSPRTGDMASVLPLLAGFLLSMSSILGGTSLRRKLKK